MNGGCGGAISENNYYYYPNWTPDGRIICFKEYAKSQDLGLGTIARIETKYYVTAMNDDGSNEENLFEISTEIKEITCSPTNELMAYITVPTGEVVISNYTGTSKTTLPDISSVEYLDWSPDADKLVYTNSSRELHVVDIDGTNDAQIATSAEAVAWRVGGKITFVRYMGTDYSRIAVINSDGTSEEVFSLIGQDVQKSENTMYYRGRRNIEQEGTNAMRSANLDGSGDTLKISEYQRSTLKLSFDNTKIVGGEFDQSGIKGIYVVNVDGSESEQLK